MYSRKTASRPARVAAVLAAVLGITSAALSGYWAAGGTALLDTVGGQIATWGVRGGPTVRIALWMIVLLKTIVGGAALAIVDLPSGWPAWTRTRVPRLLSGIAAVVLTGYGAVLTGGGLLVETGIIAEPSSADRRALAWHTYLWDPWFLIWGLAFLACLIGTRRSVSLAAS